MIFFVFFVADLVADYTMAKQGYPGMAISACFGGPLLNLLLGIGIPFTIKIIRSSGAPERVMQVARLIEF